MKEIISEIGENEILNRLKQFMSIGQIDDDTALIDIKKNQLIINTDVFVDKVHFSDQTTTPENIGWKAISANISDLVSSGVEEIIGITVGLICPPNTSWQWIESVYIGMDEALKAYGGNLLGGDCSQGEQKVLSITAIGLPGPVRIHRGHAQPGDVIIASGNHGLSRLGLALMMSDERVLAKNLSESLKAKAILSHQRPKPPTEALQKLIETKPKDIEWRAAGTDSSDGLYEAIKSICISSNCQATINYKNLPKHAEWPKGSHWDNWCVNGGEDFELVLSIPAKWAHQLSQKLPESKIIGIMKEGMPRIVWENKPEVIDIKSEFKHF